MALRATLGYHGKERLLAITPTCLGPGIAAVPDAWRLVLPGPSVKNLFVGACSIKPGCSWTRLVFVHHSYSGIRMGNARITIGWPVCEPDRSKRSIWFGRVIGGSESTIEVDVPPASPENLRALRQRMDSMLTQGKVSDPALNARSYVRGLVGYTKHREFTPLAIRLLAASQSSGNRDLLEQVKSATATKEEAIDAHLDHFNSDPAQLFLDVFLEWQQEARSTVSRKQIGKLKRCDQVWVRVLAYATFPEEWDAASRDELLAQVGYRWPTDFRERVARLLSRLDDESFAVREAASVELGKAGEFVETQLRAFLQGQPSAEARHRVREVLKKVEADPARAEQPWERAVKVLSWHGSKEARQGLELLAGGPAEAALTKAARQALQRLEGTPVPATQP